MFGFSKKEREIDAVQTLIGRALHRQIKSALVADDTNSTNRLNSSFTVGYIYAFVLSGFRCKGIEIASQLDKQIQYICEGVIPGKLYNIYSAQASALEFAKMMKDQEKEIFDTGMSAAKHLELWASGAHAGRFDAPAMESQSAPADNLRRFLLSDELKLV